MAIQGGAIVWLKSGSPAMTVKWKTSVGDWFCSWFVGSEVKEHAFDESQLTTKDPSESGF